MITFNEFKQRVNSIEYGFHNPESAVVLVPFLSTVVKIIRTNNLREKAPKKTDPQPIGKVLDFHKEADRFTYWHFAGAFIKFIALRILFTPPSLIAGAIALSCLYEVITLINTHNEFGTTAGDARGSWALKS